MKLRILSCLVNTLLVATANLGVSANNLESLGSAGRSKLPAIPKTVSQGARKLHLPTVKNVKVYRKVSRRTLRSRGITTKVTTITTTTITTITQRTRFKGELGKRTTRANANNRNGRDRKTDRKK